MAELSKLASLTMDCCKEGADITGLGELQKTSYRISLSKLYNFYTHASENSQEAVASYWSPDFKAYP